MASVYNEGIEDRMATFETEVRTPQAIAAQLTALIDRYPAVVIERDARVVGFAWTS